MYLVQTHGFVIVNYLAITSCKIDNHCHELWVSNDPDFWLFAVLHRIMFWFSIGIINIIAFFSVLKCCEDRKSRSYFNNRSVNQSNYQSVAHYTSV